MSHGFELEGHTPAAPVLPARGAVALAGRALGFLNRSVLGVSMLALLGACGILTSSVFLRYFLHEPTDWQDEAAVFLLVGATFLCGAHVQGQRGHIGIEALAGLLPPVLDRVRRLFCDLASAAFCAFFCWKSWTLFHEAYVDGQTTSSSWAPPLAIPYGLMSVGMTLLVLQLLLQVALHFVREDKR
ncbi:TRAP transporter small permease [Derxia gummosa]|uniref:TRAP transporter small permease protein n=1 Tax=Derxia gummosa DSM 723 TaxID=1121388 RepID=A0A8B6X4R0_9BURK|nr:TRAP transporter small permease [Derxia gummosa]